MVLWGRLYIQPPLQIQFLGQLADRPYKSAICSNAVVEMAGKTAPTNGLQPPLQKLCSSVKAYSWEVYDLEQLQ